MFIAVLPREAVAYFLVVTLVFELPGVVFSKKVNVELGKNCYASFTVRSDETYSIRISGENIPYKERTNCYTKFRSISHDDLFYKVTWSSVSGLHVFRAVYIRTSSNGRGYTIRQKIDSFDHPKETLRGDRYLKIRAYQLDDVSTVYVEVYGRDPSSIHVTTTTAPNTDFNGGLSPGGLAGICVGVFCVIVMFAAIGCIVQRKRFNRLSRTPNWSVGPGPRTMTPRMGTATYTTNAGEQNGPPVATVTTGMQNPEIFPTAPMLPDSAPFSTDYLPPPSYDEAVATLDKHG